MVELWDTPFINPDVWPTKKSPDLNPVLFCSVPWPSSIRGLATPWTYFLHLSMSSDILIDSCRESLVHDLMLSIQAARDLPRLRTPGIVPCIISFSRQFPCFLMVCPQYVSFLALPVSNSSLFTPALLRTHSFFSQLSTKHAESFSVSSFHSRTWLQATRAFISLIFVEVGMLWLFLIFLQWCPDCLPSI